MNIKSFKPILFLLMVAILSGCSGLKKMQKNADQIQFKVTPEVLESHAGKVNFGIDTRYPAKYFDKKATVVATPVLKYEAGKTEFTPATVQGESVKANNRVINYSGGGSVSYKDAVNYDKAMAKSELYMNMTATRGKKSLTFDPVKIANGVLATGELVANFPKPILGVRRDENNTGKYDPNIDPFQRIVPDEVSAAILYEINKANLQKDEIEKKEVVDLQNYTKKANADEKIDLKRVEVSAYASPDGTIDLNTELAAQRKESSTDFLANKLKEAGVNIELKTKYTPEDWDGFRELMEKSNIQDKELILRVLSMYNDPEVREREIKNLSTSVDLIGKTDEELKALAKSDPASLNPAELLYAATLFEDLNEQLGIYNSFIKIYPNDWRGPNNAGFVLAKQMKYDEAKPLFEKAETLKNNEIVVKNNLGAIALKEGDVKKAETLFGAASGAGNEVNYNLGIVSLKNAEYDKAVKYFVKDEDVNTALAKMMAGNNNGALQDLEAFDRPNCFMKEYLKAVIGARTAKENLLFESLEKAVSFNPEMKVKARTDMEFARYFENPKFKEIVK
jgi:Flp pilus assembly protein TadD